MSSSSTNEEGENASLFRDLERSSNSGCYGSSESSLVNSGNRITAYKRRYWILLLFSLMAGLQSLVWNTWGPISQSAIEAFPGWTAGTVAMMGNWGTISYALFVLPTIYLLNRKGLRFGVVCASFFVACGTSLRCITIDTTSFTAMCHIGAILNGIAGIVGMTGPSLLSSLWFPHYQRTTATAFSFAFIQGGTLVSYFEPYVVRSPGPGVARDSIEGDIHRMMFCVAGAGLFLFICIWRQFEDKPPLPPSITSAEDRYDFKQTFYSLKRNKPFLLALVSYSASLGVPAAWMSVLNFSFLVFGFQQDEVKFIGMLAVACSTASLLAVGRLTDCFYGHLKETLIALNAISFLSFTWFLFLTLLLSASKWQIYTSVILGVATSMGTIPLYFELGIESSFPVPEAIVSGIFTAGNNAVGIIFLLLFFIPTKSYLWVAFFLVGSPFLGTIPLLLESGSYSRFMMDQY